jgi:WhiB family redox-sensing transcriptional regulator
MGLELYHLSDDDPWRLRAVCKSVDPALFFPLESDIEGQEFAKQICMSCPVRIPCLESAISEGSAQHGVQGGMTEVERRSEIRRRRRRENR